MEMTAGPIPAVIFILVGMAIGLVIGIPIGALFFTQASQIEIRKRLERGRYNSTPINIFAESRREKRFPVRDIVVNVRAPVLDSAGFESMNEEAHFFADVIDFTPKGLSMLSPSYVSVGTTIYLTCESRKYNFVNRSARVRYIILAHRGIRVGLEFHEPLRNII